MVFFDESAWLEIVTLHVYLPDIVGYLLLFDLRDGRLYEKDHIVFEFDLCSPLLVLVLEVKDVYRVEKGVNEVLVVGLDAVLVKLELL